MTAVLVLPRVLGALFTLVTRQSARLAEPLAISVGRVGEFYPGNIDR
jgi:hypothetical protein